ncbi:MAG: hypothetical protein CMI31_05005 [Opitutae bacterium]|nr:hypothetical protein [Opitutae bacterium]|tara:strand:+ start:3830 stop:4939 length:1110 start_codon:yes stop_codon:yes gene_type:complete
MILAFADDFSGAAEVAGVAYRHGLETGIASGFEIPECRDFVAMDMATRSMTELEAEATVREYGKLAAKLSTTLLYKKTDSVLRGHLKVELSAMLTATGRETCLLIPANPARNRTIVKGIYRIKDTPLVETEFARDPTFPISSSFVTELVRGATSLSLDCSLPKSGLFIGDAVVEGDLDHWAEKATPDTLPAGASPFLGALLRAQGKQTLVRKEPKDMRQRKIFLVCGTQSDSARKLTESLRAYGRPVFETSDFSMEKLPRLIAQSLNQHQVTVLRHPLESNDSPKELTKTIASLTQKVLELHEGTSPHICLEGGETAAATLELLGERRFVVLHEWDPGVVTLVSKSDFRVTVKPGSYTWPDKVLGVKEG